MNLFVKTTVLKPPSWFYSITASALMALMPSRADILCWQVNDTATVDGGDVYTFLSAYPTDDDNWSAARVKISGGGLQEPVVLGIWDLDGSEEWDGTWGLELCDGGNGWGTGQFVQSTVPDYSASVAEVLFQVQLGHNSWDDGAGDYIWTTLAESESEMYRDLVGRYTYERFDISPPSYNSWTPTVFHSVPEPNTALLLALGVAALSLLRPRR